MEQLCRYLEETLDARAAEALREHTRSCVECRLVVESARETLESIGSIQ